MTQPCWDKRRCSAKISSWKVRGLLPILAMVMVLFRLAGHLSAHPAGAVQDRPCGCPEGGGAASIKDSARPLRRPAKLTAAYAPAAGHCPLSGRGRIMGPILVHLERLTGRTKTVSDGFYRL